MAALNDRKNGKKRKQAPEEVQDESKFSQAEELEMMSDEEGEDGVESDDGGVDEFPEIDTRSDSDEDDAETDADETDEDGEEDESEADSDDSELHIFPKAKTVISGITGKPKKVYPEIEPNYDSDSSTEDVS